MHLYIKILTIAILFFCSESKQTFAEEEGIERQGSKITPLIPLMIFFEDFPSAISNNIFSFLSPAQLIKISYVSHYFKKIAEDNTVWSFLFTKHNIPMEVLNGMSPKQFYIRYATKNNPGLTERIIPYKGELKSIEQLMLDIDLRESKINFKKVKFSLNFLAMELDDLLKSIGNEEISIDDAINKKNKINNKIQQYQEKFLLIEQKRNKTLICLLNSFYSQEDSPTQKMVTDSDMKLIKPFNLYEAGGELKQVFSALNHVKSVAESILENLGDIKEKNSTKEVREENFNKVKEWYKKLKEYYSFVQEQYQKIKDEVSGNVSNYTNLKIFQ